MDVYEEDEPVEDVLAAFRSGPHLQTKRPDPPDWTPGEIAALLLAVGLGLAIIGLMLWVTR